MNKVDTSLIKFCTGCNTTKSIIEYHKDVTNKDGLAGTCRVCTNKRKSLRRKELKKTLLGHMTQAINWIKKRAKKKNKEFNLSIDDLIKLYAKQQGKCALSGIELEYGDNPKGYFSTLSIDRIDSNKGYTADNIQLLCNGVNTMKLSLSQDKFIELCRIIANKNKEQ